VQYPHWKAEYSKNDRCTRCKFASEANPSMVNTRLEAIALTGVMHE
jgi:hypothetical protein